MKLRSAVSLLILLGALVGCAPSSQSGLPTGSPIDGEPSLSDDGSIPVLTCDPLPLPDVVPTFTGPWASDFDREYRLASSQMTRDILEDSRITVAENAELDNAYIQCMTNLGFTNVEIYADGSGSIDVPPELAGQFESLDHSCDCSVGWSSVSAIYHEMQGNPDNVDSVEIMVQCLIRVGLEPPGYLPHQYLDDLNAGIFDDMVGDDSMKFFRCNADPAHAKWP